MPIPEFAQPAEEHPMSDTRPSTGQTNGFQIELARSMGVTDDASMLEWISVNGRAVRDLIETDAKLRDDIRSGRIDEAIAFVKSRIVH